MEVVAVAVIATVLAAYAIPRMMGPSDVAAKVTADRVLAALHYAQTLAQRQGVATSVDITTAPNHLAVRYQVGSLLVDFPTQNYDGSDSGGKYDANLSPDVTINSAATTSYDSNGIPTTIPTYTFTRGNLDKFIIKVEPTGFAHFE